MAHEHQPEHRTGGERSHAELETAAHRQLEHLRRHERTSETDRPEHRAEAARETIRHHNEKAPEPEHATAAPEAAPRSPTTHLLNPRLNYAHTMASLQRRLAPASRSFSRFIHRPAIEKVSESLERTVARPSVTAGATWTALIVGGVFYLTARHYGYNLSGSEIDLSFLVGAVVGLLLEMLWRSFYRHRRR